MRILMINTVYAVGSTGKIVKQISRKAKEQGFECMVAHRYETEGVDYPENAVAVSSWWDCHIHNRLSQLTMLRGAFSKFKTRRFLKKVKKFAPHIIHLHNIHGNFINLSLLFKYIKKHGVKVVWTFHDCWPLTGNCKHFDMVACDKWKTGCGNCPQKGRALVDISAYMYGKKQRMFDGINDMTIVTPSAWLAEKVRSSPLGKYPIKLINNGIDLSVFKPTESEFRQKYGLGNKKIILGVSFEWDRRKGLDVFANLAETLPADYQIVLVGANDEVKKTLPGGIITIPKTDSQKELAEIYTAADLFVNPTREDTYPTVNMEAIACGTPVVSFNTGGCPEIADDSCGLAVARDDVAALTAQIIKACEKQLYTKAACLARAKSFNMHDRFEEYIKLYEDLI